MISYSMKLFTTKLGKHITPSVISVLCDRLSSTKWRVEVGLFVHYHLIVSERASEKQIEKRASFMTLHTYRDVYISFYRNTRVYIKKETKNRRWNDGKKRKKSKCSVVKSAKKNKKGYRKMSSWWFVEDGTSSFWKKGREKENRKTIAEQKQEEK